MAVTPSLLSLGRVGSQLLDLAFPATCAGCRKEGSPLCAECRPVLEARHGVPPGVALGLPSPAPLPLLQLEWCAPYEGAVRAAIRDLKYGGERRLAAILGAAIASRWREAGRGAEVVVPVPVHASRRRERGFDQAELIARAAADGLGLPMRNVLLRTRATARQYSLDRADRSANVAAAFAAIDCEVPGLDGRWILLVDDVATTGATLVECADALLRAGVGGVSAVTVARDL